MRKVHDTRRRPGAPDITRIRPTVKSRDDIPAILIGLQDLYSDEGTRKRLFGFPGRMVLPGKSRPEDRHGFLPPRSVMWEGSDVDVAVPMGGEARARFPDLSVVSFDRGPHSPPDRLGPAGMLELNAMPRKGRLSKADRVRESGEAFRGARRAHAAGGSAISNLEHRGLDRVGGHGKEGFAGAVALAVLARMSTAPA